MGFLVPSGGFISVRGVCIGTLFVVLIHTYFNPDHQQPAVQAEFVRLFERSWTRHGWQVRILTPRIARQSPLYAKYPSAPQLSAMHAAGGGWFADLTLMNLGFKPYKSNGSIFLFQPVTMLSYAAFLRKKDIDSAYWCLFPLAPQLQVFTDPREAARCLQP